MNASRASNVVLVIDRSCPEPGPCHIAEMTHGEEGLPTGFLWCDEHGNVVGAIYGRMS